MRLRFMNMAVALLAAGCVVFCAAASSYAQSPEPDQKADNAALVIASHSNYPPYEYFDPRKGSLTGFNVEILNALAHRMGVEVEYRRMTKSDGLSALVNGELDGVLGIAYSIERDKLVDFTSPLCTVSDVIFVHEDTDDIVSIIDLRGRTVAVDSGDFIGDVLQRQEQVHLVSTDSYEHALELLRRGDVAAFVGSHLTGQYLINKDGPRNVKVVGSPIHQVGYGIAVREENHRLVSRLEKALGAIKESGEYDRIFEAWFGEDLQRQTGLTRLFAWTLAIIISSLGVAGWLVNRRLRQRVETSARELAESRTSFQRKANEYISLFEGANDAIFLISPADGRFLEVNRKAEELTGYSRDELLKMSMRDIHLPTDGARVDKRLLQIATEGSGSFDDAPMLRKDGAIARVDISASLIRYSGSEVIQSFIRDITEKKLLEKRVMQTDKLASIGTFTAGLAHEIRNPLNSVNLQLLLLERRILDGTRFTETESLELINIVREEVSRLDNLVTEFLFFAKPLNLDFHPCNIHRIIDDVFALFYARIEQNQISLERKYMDNMPLLSLDTEKIKQALINIVQNSIEAMGDGGVLSVTTELRSKKVVVRVGDSGAGIPKEDLDKVFEVFYTSKEKGTGLGLPISFHIIELHGGTIEIGSENGAGTTCTMSFMIGPPKYQSMRRERPLGA